MTIHDTIDHKHNVEHDGEGSNEMANSHIFISLTLELLSYARFIYWLSLVSYCSTMRGGGKGQVHYQKIPRKDYLLSPASLLRIDLLISSLSLIPDLSGGPAASLRTRGFLNRWATRPRLGPGGPPHRRRSAFALGNWVRLAPA